MAFCSPTHGSVKKEEKSEWKNGADSMTARRKEEPKQENEADTIKDLRHARGARDESHEVLSTRSQGA